METDKARGFQIRRGDERIKLARAAAFWKVAGKPEGRRYFIRPGAPHVELRGLGDHVQILTKRFKRETPASRSAQQLDALVNGVAESDTFRSAPMMRTLLVYLWKHRGERINEYAIAVEALGRPQSFDPKTDSTARVQIARLRAKLKEFYERNAGSAFPLRLSIPLGQHELQFVYEQPRTSLSSALGSAPRSYLIGIIASALISILCTYLLTRNPSAAQPQLPRFWTSFLKGGKPTMIVVPSPLYFFWPSRGLYVRDLKISEFSNWPSSPHLRDLAGKLGPPTLAQTYVGAMEMGTAVKVLQYLDQFRQPVQMIESRKFSSDSMGSQNTIFLGMPRTTVYLDQLSQKLNFYIAQVEPDIVRSRNPKPGETAEFKQADYSDDRKVYPEIIALLPARPEHTRSLLMFGRALTGIPAMLTSHDGLKMLDEQWKKAGSPDAFELVIEAELYRNDTVLKLRPAAFRAISADFWK